MLNQSSVIPIHMTSVDAMSLSLHKIKAQWILKQHASAIARGTCEVTVPYRLGWSTFEYDVQYAYKISLVLEIPPAAMLIFYIVCNKLSLSTMDTVISVTKTDCIVCLSELFSQFYAVIV